MPKLQTLLCITGKLGCLAFFRINELYVSCKRSFVVNQEMLLCTLCINEIFAFDLIKNMVCDIEAKNHGLLLKIRACSHRAPASASALTLGMDIVHSQL